MNYGKMRRKEKPRERTVSGLRTRYFPKSRIGQGLISIAPWFDIILLVFFFVLLDAKFVLQPGVVIDLPEASFSDGLRSGLIAVVLSVESVGGGSGEEIIFFDDERFLVKRDEQMEALKAAFAKGVAKHPDSGLIIQADRHVQHGTLMRLFNMAREVGIRTVNVAARNIPGPGR